MEEVEEAMKGYSAFEIFSKEEIQLFEKAEEMVSFLAETSRLRCHELARAVGRLLNLQHQDGYYGFVNHTWLWTTAPAWNTLNEQTRLNYPNILDVYSVGQLPMVRLVDGKHTSLPHVGWAYRPGKLREEDIDQALVDKLYGELKLSLE